MQTAPQVVKLAILLPTLPFQNANLHPFSNQNFVLVKYHF